MMMVILIVDGEVMDVIEMMVEKWADTKINTKLTPIRKIIMTMLALC